MTLNSMEEIPVLNFTPRFKGPIAPDKWQLVWDDFLAVYTRKHPEDLWYADIWQAHQRDDEDWTGHITTPNFESTEKPPGALGPVYEWIYKWMPGFKCMVHPGFIPVPLQTSKHLRQFTSTTPENKDHILATVLSTTHRQDIYNTPNCTYKHQCNRNHTMQQTKPQSIRNIHTSQSVINTHQHDTFQRKLCYLCR